MNEQTSEQKQLIESGQYYKDALSWYSLMCEAPIGERAFLLVITAFSAVITFASVLSFFFFLPITDVQSMVIRMDRSFDKVARVRPLVQQPSDDPNRAVLRWSLHNFVEAREAYDIDRQDMLHKRVYAIGEAQVYTDYVTLYRGNDSPTMRYERHTIRKIEVKEVQIDGDTAHVKFTATEDSQNRDPVKSVWVADISFRFTEIEVDQITGEITPMTFKVTSYKSKQTG